jgi:uncharacterized protein
MTNTSIQSPCVRNCCLNDDEICVGCYRSLEEIMQWSAASDLVKLAILDRTQQRKQVAKTGSAI